MFWKATVKNQSFQGIAWQEMRVNGEEETLLMDIPFYVELEKSVDSAVVMEGSMDDLIPMNW